MGELKTLIHCAQDGNSEAFGIIVQRFQDMAVGYAYSILSDFHLAEDAAQEAFIEAYRCLPKLRKPDAFSSWFRKIVFKHCDRIIRRKRIETCPLEEVNEVSSLEKEPPEIVEEKEMKTDVLKAIATLPEKERMVTTLFYINGCSRKEIGEFLGVTAKTVKNQLYSARNRLRDRLITMVDSLQIERVPRNNQFANKEEYKLKTENEIRIGTRRDYYELVRLRAGWIDWFCQSHPGPERWCPAMCRVPRIEDENDLLWHLIGKNGRWAVIYRSQGELQGYILCRSDSDKKELLIEGQTPRVSPSLVDSVIDEVGKELIQFVLKHGVDQGLNQVKMSFHGFSDEISPLMRIYREEGFVCEPWRCCHISWTLSQTINSLSSVPLSKLAVMPFSDAVLRLASGHRRRL